MKKIKVLLILSIIIIEWTIPIISFGVENIASEKVNIENEEHILEEKMANSKEVSNIKYCSYTKINGWEESIKKDGEKSGIEDSNNIIKSIKIVLGNSNEILKDSNILYQVYNTNDGWQNWKKNGETAGFKKKIKE